MHLLMARSCVLLLVTITGAGPASGEARLESRQCLLAPGDVLLLRIDLDEAALAALRLQPRSYVKGMVTEIENLKRQSAEKLKRGIANGTASSSPFNNSTLQGFKASPHSHVYPNVGVHLKGNYGTFQEFGKKPSLTLNFDKFVPRQKFHGVDKLHLNNSAQDPSFMSEVICRELFQAAGVPVARASHAKVELNGRQACLYVLVEGYNKAFLKRYFEQTSGHFYDSEFEHDVTEPLKSSPSGGPPDRSDLQRLVNVCQEVMSGEDRGQKTEGQQGRLLSPALSSAEEERGKRPSDVRLRRLEAVLDLDRFYSFLALEIMTCHFDGYARGINNYWVYAEPRRSRREPAHYSSGKDQSRLTSAATIVGGDPPGKMVFMPHGMDQMFYEPQGSLFPELKGLVAQAALATAEGRSRFRERCTLLFTNLFLGLTNRVDQLHARLRGQLANSGPDTLAQQERAVAALRQRIGNRVAYLQKHLLAAVPVLTSLKAGESTAVTNWLWSIEEGRATMWEEVRGQKAEGSGQKSEGGEGLKVLDARSASGRDQSLLTSTAPIRGSDMPPDRRSVLVARLEPTDKDSIATWEARVLLPQGVYRISGSVSCDQAIFRGPESPVSLKIWGGDGHQFESNRSDAQHLDLQQVFTIPPGKPEEILIQCQSQTREKAAVALQFGSLFLSRVE